MLTMFIDPGLGGTGAAVFKDLKEGALVPPVWFDRITIPRETATCDHSFCGMAPASSRCSLPPFLIENRILGVRFIYSVSLLLKSKIRCQGVPPFQYTQAERVISSWLATVAGNCIKSSLPFKARAREPSAPST